MNIWFHRLRFKLLNQLSVWTEEDRMVLLKESLATRNLKLENDKSAEVETQVEFNLSCNGHIQISRGVQIRKYTELKAEGILTIGENTFIGRGCNIASLRRVTIGSDCLIAEGVSIRDHDHRFDQAEVPYRLQGHTVAEVHIGNNVWIGAKATISKGVAINDNSVVGANAMVTHDVAAGSVVAGVPAREIRLLRLERSALSI